MAKINTTNYQPVAAWNGTQDLFVVEQPDGTKVATPEQVKQYVEAGDFEATGEVKDGHGNILKSVADQINLLNDKLKRLNNIKIIDENFAIYFIGYSDINSRVLCPINFPFAFSDADYTLFCSKIELVGIGSFTTGISVNTKLRSSALIILNRTSTAGESYMGIAYIQISRTE